MKPSGWNIATYFTLVFIAGLAVGLLAGRYVIHPDRHAGQPPRKSADSFRKMMVEDMTKRLNLDAQQVAGLNQIYDDVHKEFRDFHDRHKDEMKAIYDRQHARISAMLRPDQRLIYDKIEAERLEKMKAAEQRDSQKDASKK